MPLLIHHIPAPTDDARILITELETELSAEYDVDQRHGLDLSRIFQPHILFFIAYLASTPAGCGGVAFENSFAELKRMYVRPAFRAQSVPPAIRARLEKEARARNIPRVVLETGDAQHAAIRF